MIRHHHARMRAFLLAFVCLAGVSIATPARAGSIVVEPGSFAGYIPLTIFGTAAQSMPSDGILTFNTGNIFFAGQTFNQVSMAENGYAVLGGASSDLGTNQSLPNSASPNAILAPFWTDLTGGEYRVETLTDGVGNWVVLDWNGVKMAGGATINFQIWLGMNGGEDITFAYGPTGVALPTSGLLTIGAEDPAGYSGMNHYYNGTGTLPAGDLRVHSNGPTPVPEPATMTLLGAGLLMSAVAGRRATRRRE